MYFVVSDLWIKAYTPSLYLSDDIVKKPERLIKNEYFTQNHTYFPLQTQLEDCTIPVFLLFLDTDLTMFSYRNILNCTFYWIFTTKL